MKVAIIGSSHLTENEERTARQFSATILNNYLKQGTVILISGGAKGVDSEAENVAKQLGIKCEIEKYKPKTRFWETGFKPRNMMIAQDCDVLYCFPTKFKTTGCYHCKTDKHEVTGGCWTLWYAKSLKKETYLLPLL